MCLWVAHRFTFEVSCRMNQTRVWGLLEDQDVSPNVKSVLLRFARLYYYIQQHDTYCREPCSRNSKGLMSVRSMRILEYSNNTML